MWRSKRPGRINAGSNTSGRLVEAIKIMPCLLSKPSSSINSWLRVCSRSSCPPPIPAKRRRPTASNSSIKIIAGEFFLAWSNKSRTRAAPTPTNISTNSEAEAEKNATPASPATALANRVLPVPGAPYKSTPLGNLPPNFWNFLGFFKNLITSSNSSLASSHPATSLNVTDCLDGSCILALLRAKFMALLPSLRCGRINTNHQKPMSNTIHMRLNRMFPIQLLSCSALNFIFPAASSSTSLGSSMRTVLNLANSPLSFLYNPLITPGATVKSDTSPTDTFCLKSE